jgi:hypothetical protein
MNRSFKFNHFPYLATVGCFLLSATSVFAEPDEAPTPNPEEPPAPVAEEPPAPVAEEPPAPVAEEPPASSEEEEIYEGVAEVQAPPHEATKRTLDREQLTTVPGTRGDALRAVEIMPGVGRTQFGINPGPPLLRGSPSSESLVLLDGAPMPLLYHFGGLTSVFNSYLLESVTLYPGNSSARYGRIAGGVVDVRVRDPRSDAPHLLVDVSALDSSIVAETPLGEATQLAVGARRSNVDLFFDALLTEDSTAIIAAPVYWDYQAILAHRFDVNHKVRFIAYGASDGFELHFGEALAEDPALQGEFGSDVSFHRLQVELDSQLSDMVRQQLMLSSGFSPGKGELGSVRYDYDSWDSTARGIWSLAATPWLGVDAGFDVQMVNVDFMFQGPPPVSDDGVPSQGSLASESGALLRESLDAVRPGVFLEASLRPVAEWLLVPGVRADYIGDASALTIDPRLSSRVEVGPTTTLKAAAGLYSQPPQFWEVFDGFANPDLKPYRTLQTSLGVEQVLGPSVKADVDAFYKHWMDRIMSTQDGAPPFYENTGTGDAYGLEFLIDVQATERTRALLAYTLSRSARDDGAGTRLFDDDQTHNLSFAASCELGRGWLTGARFRYVTGNPYSSVQGAVYDASTDTYRPLYGELNDARNPAFHQLDLRIEKQWNLGALDLTAYLEVMNVYNRENEESRRYSFDYRESTSVSGLPFFPNLGIKGEL